MTTFRTLPVVAGTLLMLATTSLPFASAQGWSTSTATAGGPIVALADSMPTRGARAIVFFRARPTGRHVIMLSAQSARPHDVGAALALLGRLEREHAHDDLSAVVPVSAVVARRAIAPSRTAAWDEILRRTRARPSTRIGNVGTGRWLALP